MWEKAVQIHLWASGFQQENPIEKLSPIVICRVIREDKPLGIFGRSIFREIL
jgi:hypothetical protein